MLLQKRLRNSPSFYLSLTEVAESFGIPVQFQFTLMTNNGWGFFALHKNKLTVKGPLLPFSRVESLIKCICLLKLLPNNNSWFYHTDDLIYFIRYLQSIKNVNDHKSLFLSLSPLFPRMRKDQLDYFTVCLVNCLFV